MMSLSSLVYVCKTYQGVGRRDHTVDSVTAPLTAGAALCLPRAKSLLVQGQSKAQGDLGHPSPAQSSFAPCWPLSSSQPITAPSRQKPAAVWQRAELPAQAGLRLITGAISWQQGHSRWEIVTAKKPQGWDTSDQSGMIYPGLEQ